MIWPWYSITPNRYEINLLNEVINIDFGQGAAKISEVKVGVRKKYLPTRPAPGAWVSTTLISRYFFQTQTLNSDIFAAPWKKSMFSMSFERSISIELMYYKDTYFLPSLCYVLRTAYYYYQTSILFTFRLIEPNTAKFMFMLQATPTLGLFWPFSTRPQ